MHFIARLRRTLPLLWPPTALRVIRRGAEAVAAFRAEHGREPTEQEWLEISRCVDRDLFPPKSS